MCEEIRDVLGGWLLFVGFCLLLNLSLSEFIDWQISFADHRTDDGQCRGWPKALCGRVKLTN